MYGRIIHLMEIIQMDGVTKIYQHQQAVQTIRQKELVEIHIIAGGSSQIQIMPVQEEHVQTQVIMIQWILF